MKKVLSKVLLIICIFFTLSIPRSYAETETKITKKEVSVSPPTLTKSIESKPKEVKTVSKLSVASATNSSGGGAAPSNVQVTSVQVEPFTGSANLSIPIATPPGRAGIQPNLVLSYSSSNRQLGLAGVGWNLDLGSIQRSTKKGIPSYDNTQDIFVMSQGGDLVADANNPGLYHPEVEGGFARIQKFSHYWEVTDKKGTKYYFGNTDDSRQYGPETSGHIFRWALNRVEDINGNYMTITYLKEDGQLYPQTIEYTGNSRQSLSPYAQISINYTAASVPSSSYIAGFKVVTAKRIDHISVRVNSALQAKHTLAYRQSVDTGRDLLKYVQQMGSDGEKFLPPVNFDYSQAGKVFQHASEWRIPPGARFMDGVFGSGFRAFDINADGYSDFMNSYPNCDVTGNATNEVFLNNKDKLWVYDPGWSQSLLSGFVFSNDPAGERYDMTLDLGIRLADVNGDGYVDAVRNHSYADTIEQKVWINNHSKLVSDPIWQAPVNVPFSNSSRIASQSSANAVVSDPTSCGSTGGILPVVFADVNGDGFEDILSNGQKVFTNQKGLNSIQTGWRQNLHEWVVPETVDFSRNTMAADLNGDGLVDIISMVPGDFSVFMNTSHGWVREADSPWIQGVTESNFSNGSILSDVNGDALVDLIVSFNDRRDPKIWINTGNGWKADSSWSLPEAKFTNRSTQLLDGNADGLIDYVVAADAHPRVYLNPGPVPSDLLQSVNNGIGAQTSIQYESALHYSNTFLPFPMQVVKSTTTTVANPVGEATSYTTRYDYAGGLWDATYREFQGFKTVKVIDADGNYSVTTFAQDHWLKGRPLETATYDAAGNLFSKSVNQWQVQDMLSNSATHQISKFVYSSRSDNYLYDGSATAKRTAQEITYGENPQYGDPTQVINYGEVDEQTGEDIGIDKITSQSEYVNNTDQWLLGLPKAVTSQDANGKTIAKTWFYYDGSSDNNAAPSLGRLTKKVNWLGVGQAMQAPSTNPQPADPKIQYSYDPYGNLQTTTDPLRRTTTIVYDNDVHIFPVQTINVLKQTIKTSYYGVEGIPLENSKGMRGLWGQTMGISDANNQTAYYLYDTFGRTVKSVGPLDDLWQPTNETIYEQNANYTKITNKARVEVGGDATIDAVSYYDGLGRLIENKSLGPNPGQYIVSGQREYNNRGLPVKQYPSRFTDKDLNTLDPIDSTQAVTQAQYDAMGRKVKSINPDGSYSNVVYDHWSTTSFDANGHMQKSYSDAFGRLIQKEEYIGADGRAVDYPAQGYKLYATTSYGYDAKGNLTSVMDTKGNVTVIKYDNLGRKIAMDDPDMGHWEYTYDANGNLSVQKDAKGKAITFYYDSLNRLVFKGQMYMTSTSPGPDAAYSPQTPYMAMVRFANYNYDDRGQLYGKGRLGFVDYGQGNESAKFVYDQVGREIKSSKTIDAKNYTVNRQYDDLNRIKQLQYPDGAKVKYTYNQAGQISTVADDAGGSNVYVKSVDYNALGQMTQVQYGNGAITAYSYDSLTKQLKRIYSSNAQGQKLQDLNYTYDALGQITKIVDALNTSSQSFKYDELNRLTYAQGSYGTKTYAYDEIGNILQKDGLTYRYGEANSRVGTVGNTKAGPHAVTSLSDGTIFKYDANGNMVNIIKADEKTTYVYDDENRLIQVNSQTSGKPTVTVALYSYDGDGGRTKKIVYRRDKAIYDIKNTYTLLLKDYNGKPWPGTAANPKRVVTRYVGQMYEEEDPGTDGNLRKTKFIYLGSTRVAAVNGEALPAGQVGISYYHGDYLGSTNVITDKAGLARELTEYDPFGLIVKHENYGDSSAAMWYYFNGKALDDETGLMYYGARYYNPKLGRFITPDTIVQAPSNPQTLNRYTYCNNNPVNLVDPTGHKWSWKKFWGAVAGAIVGAVVTVVAGPVIGTWAAATIGGAIGGVTSAAISGGNLGQGALFGAAGGFIGGGLGTASTWNSGWGEAARWTSNGLALGSVGYAGYSGSWDGLAGGFLGGYAGSLFINSQQFKNWQVGRGFRSDADVRKYVIAKITASANGDVGLGWDGVAVNNGKNVFEEMGDNVSKTWNEIIVGDPRYNQGAFESWKSEGFFKDPAIALSLAAGPRAIKIGGLPFRGLENGKWINKITGEWQEGWHFHLGDTYGLQKHHLPQEFKSWWRNLKAVEERL